MRKQVLFSAMLMLGVMGGFSTYPVPAMASVTQRTKMGNHSLVLQLS